MMTAAAQDVLDHLDTERIGMSFKGLLVVLPHVTHAELNAALQHLYDTGKINRLQVLGPERPFPVFFSLFVSTANGYAERAADPAPAVVAPPAEPERKLLTIEEATAVLEAAGWKPLPEVTEVIPAAPVLVERRVEHDRRRLTALEVIRRWRLTFPLGRVIEIVAESRKGGLSRENAALAIRMIREHVRGAE
ncbi:MAG TPA: hypothetical protein VF797_01515 [Noviherbaspirillum sp.]